MRCERRSGCDTAPSCRGGSFAAKGNLMRDGLGVLGLAAALLAATVSIGHAQTAVDPGTAPRQLGPSSATTREGGTTVFRGALGVAANPPEGPGAGSPNVSLQANPAGPG